MLNYLSIQAYMGPRTVQNVNEPVIFYPKSMAIVSSSLHVIPILCAASRSVDKAFILGEPADSSLLRVLCLSGSAYHFVASFAFHSS